MILPFASNSSIINKNTAWFGGQAVFNLELDYSRNLSVNRR